MELLFHTNKHSHKQITGNIQQPTNQQKRVMVALRRTPKDSVMLRVFLQPSSQERARPPSQVAVARQGTHKTPGGGQGGGGVSGTQKATRDASCPTPSSGP